MPGYFAHPDRRRVDQAVGSGHRRGDVFRHCGSPRTEVVAQTACHLLGSLAIRIDDREGPGAELHHMTQWHVRELAPETLRKAPPVRVVADRAAVREDDGVDGIDHPGIRHNLVEERITARLHG